MANYHLTAFYPSRPFWAASKVDFSNQSADGWFHNQMVEEVFSRTTDTHTIKVCRDGRIMLRIEELEEPENSQVPKRIEESVKRWGEYLDFLNAFYLLRRPPGFSSTRGWSPGSI